MICTLCIHWAFCLLKIELMLKLTSEIDFADWYTYTTHEMLEHCNLRSMHIVACQRGGVSEEPPWLRAAWALGRNETRVVNPLVRKQVD